MGQGKTLGQILQKRRDELASKVVNKESKQDETVSLKVTDAVPVKVDVIQEDVDCPVDHARQRYEKKKKDLKQERDDAIAALEAQLGQMDDLVYGESLAKIEKDYQDGLVLAESNRANESDAVAGDGKTKDKASGGATMKALPKKSQLPKPGSGMI